VVQTEMTLITKIIPEKLPMLRQVLANVRPSLIQEIGTVHFARWVIIDNDTRLLFDSNFDGTWDQYLDDFIDHEDLRAGLDRIWGCCEGYPEQGAADRDNFRAWVRAHQTPAAVFYSAYPENTLKDVLKAISVRDKFVELLNELQ
jgi:hypothetical protein